MKRSYRFIQICSARFPPVCSSCNVSIDNNDIWLELLVHGYFALQNHQQGRIYISCPNPSCRAPFLLKCVSMYKFNKFAEQTAYMYAKEDASQFDIFESDASDYFEVNSHRKPSNFHSKLSEILIPCKFRYHSSVQIHVLKSLTALGVKSERILRAMLFNRLNIKEEKILTNLRYRRDGINNYCSLHHASSFDSNLNHVSFFDSNFFLGYPITIWWLNNNQISQLITLEKEKKIRIFPRYLPYDSILKHIDNFCWKYFLSKEYYQRKKEEYPSHELTTSNGKNSTLRNIQFLKLLEWLPRMTNSFDLRNKGLSYEGRYEYCSFLNVLSEYGVFDYKPYTSLFLHINEIWGDFHNSDLQKQLLLMSNKFIQDYLKLYLHLDFGLPKLCELLSQNFIELYKGIKHPGKRVKTVAKDSAKFAAEVHKKYPAFRNIISNDFKVIELKAELGQLANNNKGSLKFLIYGETGTGKKLFAQAIHEAQKASGRTGEFCHVNCAAIPENSFESELFGHVKGAFTGAITNKKGFFDKADKGTLFLDEIGELDLNLQKKLLTAVDDEESFFYPMGSITPCNVDVTLIFATNRKLNDEVEKGNFRKDLYHRINEFESTIPPLRNRENDIKPLVLYFLKKHAEISDKQILSSIQISVEALDLLNSYYWPGNVRQLERIIKRIIVKRMPDDNKEINPEELKLPIPKKILKNPDSSTEEDKSIHISASNFEEQIAVKPAPGKRKMPPKEVLIELLNQVYREKGKHRGVIIEVATKYLDMDQSTLSRELTVHGIKFNKESDCYNIVGK